MEQLCPTPWSCPPTLTSAIDPRWVLPLGGVWALPVPMCRVRALQGAHGAGCTQCRVLSM